jgi:hypothetical protein
VPPAKRHEGIKEFQSSDACSVALLSITAGGTGITLTAASHVVFAELFWTPALILQAEDRVHRIGQANAVTVTYLLGKNTLDDVLWTMIQSKLQVLGGVLNGEAEHLGAQSGNSSSQLKLVVTKKEEGRVNKKLREKKYKRLKRNADDSDDDNEDEEESEGEDRSLDELDDDDEWKAGTDARVKESGRPSGKKRLSDEMKRRQRYKVFI